MTHCLVPPETPVVGDLPQLPSGARGSCQTPAEPGWSWGHPESREMQSPGHGQAAAVGAGRDMGLLPVRSIRAGSTANSIRHIFP